MINSLVLEMLDIISQIQDMFILDIADIKEARHELLLERDAQKQELMIILEPMQKELNLALMQALENEEDMDVYKPIIDTLEFELKQLYEANKKFAKIVMPIMELYHDIFEEIAQSGGGNIFETTV